MCVCVCERERERERERESLCVCNTQEEWCKGVDDEVSRDNLYTSNLRPHARIAEGLIQ